MLRTKLPILLNGGTKQSLAEIQSTAMEGGVQEGVKMRVYTAEDSEVVAGSRSEHSLNPDQIQVQSTGWLHLSSC